MTVIVTEAMSAWLPFAEAMVRGPATRTVTDVVSAGEASVGGGPAVGGPAAAKSMNSMHPTRDATTSSAAGPATRM